MAPKKLEKKLRKEEKVKKAITIEKKKEIVQTYESGIRVTDLTNMYSMCLCFQMVSDMDLTLTEFWKEHYSILSCVGLIEKSWAWTLRSAWKKVWPKIIKERDCEGIVGEPEPATDRVFDDIVTIAETIGLRIDSGDVEELVEEHSEELSTEELQQFLAQQQRMAAEELSEEEGGRINNQCSKFPLLK